MKYSDVYHQAKYIDRLLDYHIHSKSVFLPREELILLILQSYPDLYVVESYGWHKVVFRILIGPTVVLKVGSKRSIENDHRAYERVPHSIRHLFFARIFWHTKYCLLQEYGLSVNVTANQLDYFRSVLYRYGVFDVKADNIRSINGELKLIDANSTVIRVPAILRKIDQIKAKLPKKIVLLGKKINKRLYST